MSWPTAIVPVPACGTGSCRHLPGQLHERLIGDKAYDSDPLDEKLAVVLSHPSGARMGRPFSGGLKLAELCSGSTHSV
jgi:hypothetical protein